MRLEAPFGFQSFWAQSGLSGDPACHLWEKRTCHRQADNSHRPYLPYPCRLFSGRGSLRVPSTVYIHCLICRWLICRLPWTQSPRPLTSKGMNCAIGEPPLLLRYKSSPIQTSWLGSSHFTYRGLADQPASSMSSMNNTKQNLFQDKTTSRVF